MSRAALPGKSEAILLASTWTTISPLFPTEYFLNDLVFWLVFLRWIYFIDWANYQFLLNGLAIAYGTFQSHNLINRRLIFHSWSKRSSSKNSANTFLPTLHTTYCRSLIQKLESLS